MALEGLIVHELTRSCLSFCPSLWILLLWTSHPVFRLQPTHLSNLRAGPGLPRLLPALHISSCTWALPLVLASTALLLLTWQWVI